MKKRDILIIACILVFAIVLYAVFELTKTVGTQLEIKVNGDVVATYSLEEDGTYQLNGGTNTLRIHNGKAWLIDADCPDHLCVKQGKISKNGETITCLPNKLTITVINGEDNFVELE